MSSVTSRATAGAAGALVAAVALGVLSGVSSAGPEPAPGSGSSLADRVPGATLPQQPGADVLPAVGDDAPVPAQPALDGLLRPLASVSALGGPASVDVVDLVTGERLTSLGQETARTPASTTKVLTAAAALARLGAQSTLPTTVTGGGSDAEVVLRGGGDILLAADAGDPAAVNGHAGLGDLARQTAAALKAKGVTSVSVALDDTLFTGPAVEPSWGSDVASGFVAPVQPLEVDAGRVGAGKYGPRSPDPALRAARQFAERLRQAGIAVTGQVARGTAPQGAAPLAEVRSASIGDLVEYALTESDNTVAEALGRLVAHEAGQPASFAGAGVAIVAEVRALGVPADTAQLTDASGLGDGSLIAPETLTGVLHLASSGDHPELRPVITGLPVAGVSGTLADRFTARDQRSSSGVVRAKTGSLNGVSSLAGTVVDADGRALGFAVLADGIAGTAQARDALDSLVTTIAGCGCR